MHVDRGWLEEGITVDQFVSRGARSSHSCKRQQNQLNHQGVKVHTIVRLREQTALCDKSVWSSPGEAARGAKDLIQGLAEGTFASSDRTRRWTCLVQEQDKHGGAERLHNNHRLHQTCGPVNQFRHVCVEECPLTTSHTAARSGDNCGGTSAGHTREL